jgi:titin
LTLTRGTTSSTLNWAAPTDNGGAAVIGYVVYRSADNGTTWTSMITNLTVTSFGVTLPAKGTKYSYAVAATNSAGTGAKSNVVTDETISTVPSAVRAISFSYPVSNKLQITWTAPLDNGGSPITAYRLERQKSDGSWLVLNESNILTFQVDRDAPGVVVVVRVTAINAVGAGPALNASYLTPLVQASAPQNFTAADNGSVVITSWTAPQNLGGSTVSYYQLQQSKDGGTTWTSIVNVVPNNTSYNVPRPVKGSTWSYRVVALTGFGMSLPSNSVAITSAPTVPGAPTATVAGLHPTAQSICSGR